MAEFGLALLLVLTFSLAGMTSAAAQTSEVRTHELDNGMKILVREDRRAPIVVNQIWYRVGSIDEHRGVTGISHVLEHMMFKGTENVESGEYSRRISRHGGRENAFTARDYTAYHQQIAADRLEMLLEMEADRMDNLVLRADEFASEIRVVQEERSQRIDDQPRSLLWERLRATAFPSSPARQPIIGWASDLESMEVDDLRDWYERWYVPNNALLVVAGDIDADAVFGLAEDHFGDIEPREPPARLPVTEIDAAGRQRFELHAPANVPYLGMAWRLPSLTTLDDPRDAWALSVLVGVLDGGRAARIESRIVRDREIAASAGAGYSPFARGQTLLTLAGTPAEGHRVEELEEAFRDEIRRLREEEIASDELERVRVRTRAEEIFELDSVAGQARRLGMLEALGLGYEVWDDYLAGVEAVTAEDVRRVAREYLTDDRLTVGTLVPENGSGRADGPLLPGGGQDDVDH